MYNLIIMMITAKMHFPNGVHWFQIIIAFNLKNILEEFHIIIIIFMIAQLLLPYIVTSATASILTRPVPVKSHQLQLIKLYIYTPVLDVVLNIFIQLQLLIL